MRHLCVWAVVGALAGAAWATDASTAMARRVDRCTLSGSLEDVLGEIGKLSGTPVRAEWGVLAEAGVTPKVAVTLAVREATVGQVLDLALAQVARPGRSLAWIVRNDAVVVSTQMDILYGGPSGRRGEPAASAPAPALSRGRLAVSKLEFDQLPVRDATAFLGEVAGVNIYVNWKSLSAIGITPDTAVDIHLTQVTLGRALDVLMDTMSGSGDKLQRAYWILNDGVITIASGEFFNQTLSTRTFDVADLLVVVPEFQGPRMDLTSNVGAAADATASRSLWETDNARDKRETTGEARARVRESLVAIVRDSIGADMWQPTGKGAIRLVGNKLVISQTPLGFKLLEDACRPR